MLVQKWITISLNEKWMNIKWKDARSIADAFLKGKKKTPGAKAEKGQD